MPGWRWGGGPSRSCARGSWPYGPLSLLGLLVTWVVLLVAGWAAVWWGLRSAVTGVDGYLDAVYFAGVGFFTVGFGDLVPTGGLARLLVLVEAFMGLVTMALVIGYLPTLYGAYSRREVHLVLDDMSDDATTPIGFLEDCYASGGGQAVAAAFTEWERWCDEVFDSHTAYPMLAMFRSRQPGQNWLTALGVVLDAATICLAAVDSPGSGRRRGCGGGPPGRCRASGGCPRPCSGRPRRTARPPRRRRSGRRTSACAAWCRCTPTSRPGPSSAGCGRPTSPGC